MNGMLTPEVLVLGGTGAVGQGVVGALLEAGSPVLVVGRDPGRLAALHEQFADEPGLETLLGSLSDDGSARVLAERIAHRPRPLAAVIAAMGGPYRRGRVTDRNGDELLGAMQADLMPHVHAVRHLLPLLQDNVHARRYVMIGSPANAKPWAGYGETSITTAALRMYAQVVHQEAQASSGPAHCWSAVAWSPCSTAAATTAPSSAATAVMPNCRAACCTWTFLPCGAIPQASLDLDHG